VVVDIATHTTSVSSATICPITYALMTGSGAGIAAYLPLTWLTMTTGNVNVNKDVVGTATVFVRVTSTNGGSTSDTNSFSVTVTCSTISTSVIASTFALTVPTASAG